MKARGSLSLLAMSLVVSAAFAATTARFTAAKPTSNKTLTSSVTVHGSSTIHEWDMNGATINGSVEVNPELAQATNAEAWKKASDAPATVSVVIPVASLRSEHAKMDSLMQNALKAKKFPEIRYDMAAPSLTSPVGAFPIVKTRGKLTIAGVTRDIDMDVTASRGSDNQYVLTGGSTIKMSDYGVKAPTAMLGTIKTGDVVKVAFRWVVERAQ